MNDSTGAPHMGKKKRPRRSDSPVRFGHRHLKTEHESNMDVKLPESVGQKINVMDGTLATASLDDLQSDEYRQVLNVVDSLRTCGLGSILPLPQLVVCGNQSSGKSSVLEAITEVPFPRNENLCTRFATEIILRRDKLATLRTKIIPDKARPEAEKAKLLAFNETITDFNGLPELIEKATEAMGLNKSAEEEQSINRAFTRDVLSVEIAGPSRPQLTLVDLPGLIQSANKMQTEADIRLIHSLVHDYVSEKRTVMLAVISAKDDYANQGILNKCKEVDKDGHRTLGIVTKPDYLKPGSNNENSWINLAQNNDIYFELGWHMVKNRSEEQMDYSFEERNVAEMMFFQSGKYRDIPENDKGIVALRTKLSKLLFQHLKKELPNLQSDLNAKYDVTTSQLEALGENRSTLADQKQFLMRIATSYQTIVASAVDGHYEHSFFGYVDASKNVNESSNVRRLRAAIQQLNLQFASQMRQFGHKFRFWATEEHAGTNSQDDLAEPHLDEDFINAKNFQTEMTRQDAVNWVYKILVCTRGCELPGNFNPRLISHLFHEQSAHWERLASRHIDRIFDICSCLIQAAIEYVCKSALADVSKKLMNRYLKKALDRRRNNAIRELRNIIQDTKSHPITYDPSYTATIQEHRSKKTTAKFNDLVARSKVNVANPKVTVFGPSQSETVEMINAHALKTEFKELINPDMDKSSAEDALDSQLAYYKDKVKYFIANVTEQVIERHLVRDLAQDTLSPMTISSMKDEEITFIAAEAEGVKRKREFLDNHKAILESGQEAFRKAMGSY